jgi:hypothetical protein
VDQLRTLEEFLHTLFPELAVGSMVVAKHLSTKGQWKTVEMPAGRPVKKGKKASRARSKRCAGRPTSGGS